MVARLVARRERRLSLWLPYAAMALLFAAFVHRGEGFAWRYVGDFWPLIVLASAQYVYALPPDAKLPLDARLAKIMFWTGFVVMVRFLVPWEWDRRADILEPHGGFNTTHGTETLAEDFRESRWGVDGPMPSRIACASRPRWPYHNGLGWKDGCAVGPATNVYLGVASKDGDHYALRFETADMTAPTVRVYVNGTLYTAERRGDAYEADVGIRYASLHSPIVMVTLLWTREEVPPPGKLLAIELI